ncbi:MAG: NADPH-dependent F420 reductase [Pseudomonadota bacterium]|nr:NADPH-dependent F420 reductase [Pseudomonadota bacterium]
MLLSQKKPIISVVGGTGDLGSALVHRINGAGYQVIIGSRSAKRARAFAKSLTTDKQENFVSGEKNCDAVSKGSVIFLCVPYDQQLQILKEISSELTGKLLIDTTVPLVPPRVARVQLPPEHSAAIRSQEFLGDKVEVVSALHNLAADHLAGNSDIDCDVLVFGNKRESRSTVIKIMDSIGIVGLHAGPLANSVAAEALTSVLIFMNRYYNSPGTGIRISRLSREVQ